MLTTVLPESGSAAVLRAMMAKCGVVIGGVVVIGGGESLGEMRADRKLVLHFRGLATSLKLCAGSSPGPAPQ